MRTTEAESAVRRPARARARGEERMVAPTSRSRALGRLGFTLIELLVVLVVIGILAAIAVPRFSKVRERAYYAALQADIRNLAAQQELYYATKYSYTSTLSDLGFVSSQGVTVSVTASASGWSATAEHDALGSDEGCTVYYGSAETPTIDDVSPTAEGQVACTD